MLISIPDYYRQYAESRFPVTALRHFGYGSAASAESATRASQLYLQREHLNFDLDIPDGDRNRPGALSWASYQGQPVVIPDMDAIEAVLQPLVRRA